ncbi:hypothetical protein DL95DRAFT_464318 [Leptodontidium sp. 2 PMI_412]|nr:hypothetical protein DL95DRAFT_464318 [Leptodontidium sp. 2 PMI_412]
MPPPLPPSYSAHRFNEPGINDLVQNMSMYGSENDFSGVAWATKEDFYTENINVVTSWPGYGREEGKAPTELFYEDGKVMWGYGIPIDATPVSWFKLLLVKDADLDEELRSSEFMLRGRKMLRENGKTAVDLIADYLRALWEHVLDTIQKARGESVVDALPFHVVITVPAIWKGYAREAMEKAVKQSGILRSRTAGPTTLTFAPEPEAAALSTLSERGDVYVICDAGGGTVDLITYEIDSSRKPISMHEAVEGTGGLCGGIFIDQAFEDMCRFRLGRKWDRLSKAGIKQIMRNEWAVGANGGFGSESLNDTSREPAIKNGRIHFKSSHIQKAFAQSFSDIQKLIEEQIERAKLQGSNTTGIILVGGLGGSPYLYEILKEKYGRVGIKILQSTGMGPRTAICRGAVYKGFMEGAGGNVGEDEPNMISITSTVSRLSFGIVKYVPYVAGQHLDADRVWDMHECKWMASNQMDWYLKRGENVSKKDPVKKSYYRCYTQDFGGSTSFALVQCDALEPPDRKTSDVTDLCKADFETSVAFSSLEEFTNDQGTKYKKLSFDLEMVPSGASLEFVVYVNGKRQGAQNVAVNFQ